GCYLECGRMKKILLLLLLPVSVCLMQEAIFSKQESTPSEMAQVPTWSQQDMNFFLHGSMSTEVMPETVLRALIRTYPDLFPTQDLSHLGLLPDPAFGWPIGFSRTRVNHLGGLSSVGINCASCHVTDITSVQGG